MDEKKVAAALDTLLAFVVQKTELQPYGAIDFTLRRVAQTVNADALSQKVEAALLGSEVKSE